jgi:uncharacterized RDD family membrane protein YckC
MSIEVNTTASSEPGELAIVQEVEYPSLLKRVQATFVDSLTTFFLTGLLITITNHVNDSSVTLKIIAIILGVSYEPLMNTFGRTAGQLLSGIRVVDVKSGKRLNLPAAYLRFFFKTILGWLSFLIMFSNAQRRAMHDYVAGSVVVHK